MFLFSRDKNADAKSRSKALETITPRVLLIDDEQFYYKLLKRTLTDTGYGLEYCNSGKDGLAKAVAKKYELFLVDLRLPDISGHDIIRILRQNCDYQNVPIIVISAIDDLTAKLKAFQFGANDYLVKPFQPDELVARMKEVTGRSQTSQNGNPGGDPNTQRDIDSLINEVKQMRREKAELRMERADLLYQLDQAQKQLSQSGNEQFPLMELSRITDGIAHDMRNGLGIIRNTIGFLKDDLKETPYFQDILKISRSVDFCLVVLRNLSSLGRQDILHLEQVDLEIIAREICFMLENKLVDIKIVIDTDNEKPVIIADEGHMKQVFMNLIKNAGEAMPEGGTLTCRFYREADMMRIEVQDTGHGISEKNQQRLFREFFTTKERGYGLGLYIVSTIVERHGGKISVQSTLDGGTIFTLFMPVEAK